MTLMNNIFHQYLEEFVLIYFDDILVYRKRMESHKERLKIYIFHKLREHQLFAKMSKCEFGKRFLEFLGHVLSNKGVQVNQEKARKITLWKEPSSMKEVQFFLGLANYYRKYVPRFSEIAAPLTHLIRNGVEFESDSKQEKAFQELK